MKSFDDRLGVVLSYLIQEREGFVEQPAGERIRDISRQIEQLVDEIPFTIHKLHSFSNILQEKLDLESFKFCFTVAASLIAELLEKYRVQKRHLRHFLAQLNSQLQNEKIEECLVQVILKSEHPIRILRANLSAWSLGLSNTSPPCLSSVHSNNALPQEQPA